MTTFRLTIECDNAAFRADDDLEPDDDINDSAMRAEVLRILQNLTNYFVPGDASSGKLYDSNGNRVGEWGIDA